MFQLGVRMEVRRAPTPRSTAHMSGSAPEPTVVAQDVGVVRVDI